MTNWEKVVEGKELLGAKRIRSKEYIFEKRAKSELSYLEKDGWEIVFEYKDNKFINVKKKKTVDRIFEDKVWMLFYNMGYKNLNKDNTFVIDYNLKGEALTQQIDVFAADEETVLIVECKAARSPQKTTSFKPLIEALKGKEQGIRKEVARKYPKRKLKFIWATSDYILSDVDKERLKNFDIIHFNEKIIDYYIELTKHLGSSAKYQLLANLFSKQKIGNMDMRVPAIEGKMGGLTYYSFSIEPDKLLKIGYVSHRNEVNYDLMPAYQRLIKKTRLNEVRNFIKNGGFFPNSIIINIDNGKKDLNFDRATNQVEDSTSKIGILHLPQKYCTAYIIDGQHRLYGYSDTEYSEKDVIPVVAFVNLEKQKQLSLFMEINENQKSVSKTLRNILEADLLWDSPNYNKQRTALKIEIAKRLGERNNSPLYDRIIMEEIDKTTSIKCIRNDFIKRSFDETTFFNKFNKDNIPISYGSFDTGDINSTLDKFYPFLEEVLRYFKESLLEEWEKGELGVLTINTGIYGIIKLLNDIINHLMLSKSLIPLNEKTQNLVKEVKYYLEPVIEFYKDIPDDMIEKIKKTYGRGGQTNYWRILQKAVNSQRKDFNPQGLEKWLKDNNQIYNNESKEYIEEIEKKLKNIFKNKLVEKFHNTWEYDGIPEQVYLQATNITAKKRREAREKGESEESVTLWDCINITEYPKIAIYNKNWSELFKDILTHPDDKGELGGKKEKIKWIINFQKLKLRAEKENYSITEEEYNFLKKTNDWLN
ncbi:DGQHR domain-containing protein [Fusobacterium ulcerans]|uniref:DGQHR domain-containing protein n=1 Tax=Fusobacterium ulcerans TaxID=861 RepID=UPI0027B9BF08|nr:DGQHR domain-containing protein [Fusobacterium ulcerans]